MLTVLVTLLTVASFPFADEPLALTSFRMEVAAPVSTPVEPLPVPVHTIPQATVLPAGGAVVISPLFNPFSAPAVAPFSSTIPPLVFAAEEHEKVVRHATVRSSTIPLTGSWKSRKRELRLSIADPRRATVYSYLLTLTTEEFSALKSRNNRPVSIVRAAGTVILLEGRRNGEFEFLPDAVFREKLNNKGWGDAASDVEALRQNAYFIYPADKDSPVATDPFELVWFKYFLAGIDEDYIEILRNSGYTDTELEDLWTLADAKTTKSLLIDVLKTAEKMFSDRPALKDFGEMQYYPRMGLSKMWDGKPKMTYAEFLALNPFSWDMPKPDSLPNASSPGLLPDLDSLSKPVGLADLITEGLPADWGMATPGRFTATIFISSQQLLTVKGRIRLCLDRTVPENVIVTYRTDETLLKQIMKSRRIILANDCGDEPIDVAVNPNTFRGVTTKRCAMMYRRE